MPIKLIRSGNSIIMQGLNQEDFMNYRESLNSLGGTFISKENGSYNFSFNMAQETALINFLKDQNIDYFNALHRIEISNYGNGLALIRGLVFGNNTEKLLNEMKAIYFYDPLDDGGSAYLVTTDQAKLIIKDLTERGTSYINNLHKMPPLRKPIPAAVITFSEESTTFEKVTQTRFTSEASILLKIHFLFVSKDVEAKLESENTSSMTARDKTSDYFFFHYSPDEQEELEAYLKSQNIPYYLSQGDVTVTRYGENSALIRGDIFSGEPAIRFIRKYKNKLIDRPDDGGTAAYELSIKDATDFIDKMRTGVKARFVDTSEFEPPSEQKVKITKIYRDQAEVNGDIILNKDAIAILAKYVDHPSGVNENHYPIYNIDAKDVSKLIPELRQIGFIVIAPEFELQKVIIPIRKISSVPSKRPTSPVPSKRSTSPVPSKRSTSPTQTSNTVELSRSELKEVIESLNKFKVYFNALSIDIKQRVPGTSADLAEASIELGELASKLEKYEKRSK